MPSVVTAMSQWAASGGGDSSQSEAKRYGDISPTLLTTRLRALEGQGLIVRRPAPGQKGSLYIPTDACEALLPVLVGLGEWGLSWAREMVLDRDLDVDFLMFYLERSIDPARLPGPETIIRFHFTDLTEQQNFWLLVDSRGADLCITDPGRDVNVYFTTTVRTMHDVWVGDRTYADAIAAGDLIVEGDPMLTRNTRAWLRPSVFADAPRAPLPATLPQATNGKSSASATA